MATTTDTTTSTQVERPGLHDGVAGEFMVIVKIKPGQADSLRKTLAGISNEFMTGTDGRDALKDIGTLHDARYVILDNDTRLLFASVFDGSWDTYIDDFATTKIAKNFELVFSHAEGFPGIEAPREQLKEWFVGGQVPAELFVSSYPELTTKQVLKDQRVNEAFQAVLDSPEFGAALKEPANAALLATPTFQKLLDEAAN